MFSPLFLCVVVNRLLRNLNDRGFYAQGLRADDLAIFVRGPFLKTFLELTQSALETVEEWCDSTNFSVNFRKSKLVIFTRKYKLGTIE